MIRAQPGPPGTKFAFTGPPPATVDAMAEMGTRLRWLRENHQNTYRGVRVWAKLLTERGYPIDFNTVSRYELGKLQVPAALVWMVAKVTRCDAGWLLAGKGPAPRGYEAPPAE